MSKFAITNFDFVLLVKVLARFCISFSFFSTRLFLSDAEPEYGRWKRSPKMFLVSMSKNVMSGENLYKLLSWFRISWLYTGKEFMVNVVIKQDEIRMELTEGFYMTEERLLLRSKSSVS